MYATSIVFLVAAVVALLLSLRAGGLALVFVSIGCSVTSALFLAVSVLRRRVEAVEEEPAPAEPASTGFEDEGSHSFAPQVVAIPRRATYHMPACRHAVGPRDAELLTREQAHERGFAPCKVCEPG